MTIDFTYTASADGKLVMTPKDRDVMTAKWQMVGDELRIHYRDVNWCKEHLDHYTLSVCLVHQLYYNYDYKSVNPTMFPNNFDEGYEQNDFHKHTGWGNWLRMNEQRLNHNPQSSGGGALE